MKKWAFIAIFTFSLFESLMAKEILEVREGDILLISLNCYSCQFIEDETNSPFSHSGIVIRDTDGELKVAQAIGGPVHVLSFKDFLSQMRPKTKASLYRSVELAWRYQTSPRTYHYVSEILSDYYFKFFEGLSFDSNYLWNNTDKNGDELIYCSELVVKLINKILHKKMEPLPMSFSRNTDWWNLQFNGIIPQGAPGVSPGDIAKSDLFYLERGGLTAWDFQ